MLPGKYRLSKKDFEKALRTKGIYVRADFLKCKIIKNYLDLTRFGISCGVKISKKATIRNLIKRRINESLRLNLNSIKKGVDILVMPDPCIIDKKYKEIDSVVKQLIDILSKTPL
jgi:ribonuclease P protein component